MDTVTIKMGKDKVKRLVGWLVEYKSIAESKLFKEIKGNDVLLSRIDQTIKYIKSKI